MKFIQTVNHPDHSNVIDKIFRKEYSQLFKNVSSDSYQQKSLVSEGTQMPGNNQEGKVINKIFSRDQEMMKLKEKIQTREW